MLKISFDLETPYRPRNKCIWPAVITAAGAIGSSALGLASQGGANSKNLQMTRETNEANMKMNERQLEEQRYLAAYQNQWNLDQWNRENAYNDPSLQAQRLRAAGINPLYGNGNVSAGEAGSLQGSTSSAPSNIPMQPGSVQPLDFSGVTSGINAFMQNQLLQTQIDKGAADAKMAEVHARTESVRVAHELFQIANDASKSEAERDMARSLLRVQHASEANQIYHSDLINKISEKEVEELKVRIAGHQIQNKLASIDSQYRARMNAAQLRSYDANIRQAYAAARAGDASAAASYAAAAVSDVTAAGIRIDNKTKESYNRAILDAAWTEAEQANDNRLFNILDKNFNYQGKVGQYFPMQSGQFSAAGRFDDWQKKNRFRNSKKR